LAIHGSTDGSLLSKLPCDATRAFANAVGFWNAEHDPLTIRPTGYATFPSIESERIVRSSTLAIASLTAERIERRYFSKR